MWLCAGRPDETAASSAELPSTDISTTEPQTGHPYKQRSVAGLGAAHKAFDCCLTPNVPFFPTVESASHKPSIVWLPVPTSTIDSVRFPSNGDGDGDEEEAALKAPALMSATASFITDLSALERGKYPPEVFVCGSVSAMIDVDSSSCATTAVADKETKRKIAPTIFREPDSPPRARVHRDTGPAGGCFGTSESIVFITAARRSSTDERADVGSAGPWRLSTGYECGRLRAPGCSSSPAAMRSNRNNREYLISADQRFRSCGVRLGGTGEPMCASR